MPCYIALWFCSLKIMTVLNDWRRNLNPLEDPTQKFSKEWNVNYNYNQKIAKIGSSLDCTFLIMKKLAIRVSIRTKSTCIFAKISFFILQTQVLVDLEILAEYYARLLSNILESTTSICEIVLFYLGISKSCIKANNHCILHQNH